jgi:DNA polymerase type B, organellar and viral
MARTETRHPLKLVLVPRSSRRYDRGAYESRRPHRSGNRHKKVDNATRPFVFWDGEGPRDAGYALFGNSLGYEICNPFLSTASLLDLLLDCATDNPTAIHVAFGFNYDASMILHDLPWRCFSALKTYNGTWWRDYELEHIPGKWFKVRKDDVSVQVFDIFSFFQCSYVSALQEHGIGDPAEVRAIAEDKARRAEFVWAEIEDIKRYFRLELKYGPLLAETLRDSFLGAGYDLRSWHGPGALARAAISRHNVYGAMCESPVDVQIAARYAFAGGRFEMFRGGHVKGKVYNADIRSAYPANARFLPNLSKGRWRRTRDFEPNRFGMYRIDYHSREKDPLYVHPLFRREPGGTVTWPRRTSGWYHSPEAALVANNPEASILEGWIFDEDDPTDRPFAWIEEYYRRRALLKRAGNPLQLTYKLIINSVYGQLAQRSGWDRKNNKAPRSHQLEWAGYITSACRSRVFQAAFDCGDKLISIDTDGIYAMAPIPGVVDGPGLGDWETTEYDEGIFWQSGIYALRHDLGYPADLGYGWEKGKTRGIPKGSYTPEGLLCAMEANEPLKLAVNTFIGYGLAGNGQFERLNTWVKEPHEIVFGGQGKRYHNVPFYCRKGGCPGNGVHAFISPPDLESDYQSNPHYLPWLKNTEDMTKVKNLVADYEAYGENGQDEDKWWERNTA